MNILLLKTQVCNQLPTIIPIDNLVQKLMNMILQREIIEISAKEEDVTMSGMMVLLRQIFEKFPQFLDKNKEKNKFMYYLIHEGLFNKDSKGQMIDRNKAKPPKCKNLATRENCLKLVMEICQKNPEGLSQLVKYLKGYICESFWRTPRKSDWSISVHQHERSLTGFVGLKNLGATCYMNSMLQQLYMIPSFRKALLEVEDP